MKNIKTIAFDMDEVIVNTLKKTLAETNRIFNLNVKREDLIGLSLREFINQGHRHKYYDLINTKGYFRDLEIMETQTRDIMEQLNKKYEIYICSAAMEVPNSLEDKFYWLREHLPFLDPRNFVFCGTKAVLHADVLVDDSPDQLDCFSGTGVLYTSPLNCNMQTPYQRVNNWTEIAELFL